MKVELGIHDEIAVNNVFESQQHMCRKCFRILDAHVAERHCFISSMRKLAGDFQLLPKAGQKRSAPLTPPTASKRVVATKTPVVHSAQQVPKSVTVVSRLN